jgi:hypothetical protein
MAIKNAIGTPVIVNASCIAGSTYDNPTASCQSASQDLTAALGALWTLRGVPASDLTTGCSWQIDISHDGATWRELTLGIFGLASGVTYDAVVDLPFSTMYTRVTFFGGSATTRVWAELQIASESTAIVVPVDDLTADDDLSSLTADDGATLLEAA